MTTNTLPVAPDWVPTSAQTLTGSALSRRWFGLAFGSLLLAGAFAIFIVVARVPFIDALISDPLFFRRCLVVHVNLALVFWFYTFIAALFHLLPGSTRTNPVSTFGWGVSAIGIVLVLAGAGSGAPPVLSNYIPAIDHWLFLLGQGLFFMGLMLTFADSRLFGARAGVVQASPLLPRSAQSGIRAAVVAFILGMLTLLGSAMTTPRDLGVETYFEFLYWGAGHVLQFSSEAGMLAVWLILLASLIGRSPVKARTAGVLFGVLLIPILAAPIIAGQGTITGAYRAFFTRIMQWGIFPIATVFLLLCIRSVVGARRDGRLAAGWWRTPAGAGFVASALLTVLGFVLGALIRGSSTMIPAHYHAAIGGVTVSFMALSYLLLEHYGRPVPSRLMKWAGRQPLLFLVGQAVFAVGFGYAGMARKAYGQEQQARTLGEYVGLFAMGFGSLIAVFAGLLFLRIVIGAWRHSGRRPEFQPEGTE